MYVTNVFKYRWQCLSLRLNALTSISRYGYHIYGWTHINMTKLSNDFSMLQAIKKCVSSMPLQMVVTTTYTSINELESWFEFNVPIWITVTMIRKLFKVYDCQKVYCVVIPMYALYISDLKIWLRLVFRTWHALCKW